LTSLYDQLDHQCVEKGDLQCQRRRKRDASGRKS
jgi:hypothetical protein